jgi:hypothetical protein
MNAFENELRKLFDHDAVFSDTQFVGRTCYGKLSNHIRVRAEFITLGYADKYDALQVSLINRTEGVIDTAVIRFADLFGSKQVSNPNFRDGIIPHIWNDGGNVKWYVYQPTKADYKTLSASVDHYLAVFREPAQELSGGMTQQMG